VVTASQPQSRPVRTLLIFLLLQSLFFTVNLKLLPLWDGETLAVTAPAAGHPSLYFLLAHAWLQIPHGAEDTLVWVRLLSGIFTIASTIAIDRLWLRHAPAGVREWFLLLWTFSPCLLLFARVAQPHSLQMLLGVLAVWCAIELGKNPLSWMRVAAFTASVIALHYTDGVAGLAVWAGANVLLLMRTNRRREDRWRSWLQTNLFPNVVIIALYLRWLLRWQEKPKVGGEPILKAAYWFYSFAFGEAVPVWLLAASALLAAPYIWLLYSGVRAERKWMLPGMVMALVGFTGAALWVAPSLMGARLLFLLPVFLLAIAAGIETRGRIATIIGMLIFAANLAGVWAYFGARDFLNTGYLFPSQRIATAIAILSSPDDTTIWIDSIKIDASALKYYLPKNFRIKELTSPQSAADARAELASSNIRHVWFIRNTLNAAFEPLENEMNRTWYNHTVRPFVPFSLTQKVLMQTLALVRHRPNQQTPRYVYEVWEYQKPAPPGR
jgi:hypothetical protein